MVQLRNELQMPSTDFFTENKNMTPEPLVSIILPVWNGEKYLAQAIEAILKQSYVDFELILVNDFSTDSTQEIIAHYVKIDSRIHCINNPTNLKLPESLNRGFKIAKGEWHTWTSDDNFMESNWLEDLLNFAIDSNSDFVYSDYNIVNEIGRTLRIAKVDEPNQLYEGNCVGASFLYKAEITKSVGQYDSRKFMYEDFDYWVRIYLAGWDMKKFDTRPNYFYRIHEKQLSKSRKLPFSFIDYRMNLIGKFNNIEFDRAMYAEVSIINIALRNGYFFWATKRIFRNFYNSPILISKLYLRKIVSKIRT